MPGRGQRVSARRVVLTFGFAGMDVDLIVACTVVRDPLHAGRKPCDQLTIIDPDARCGDVAAVDPDSGLVGPTRLETGKEFGAIRRIVHLGVSLDSNADSVER